MSDLVAVAYPDEATARDVMATLARLKIERNIVLKDAIVVTRREDGKVKLHQSASPGAAGAASGAPWGGLIGLIFLTWTRPARHRSSAGVIDTLIPDGDVDAG